MLQLDPMDSQAMEAVRIEMAREELRFLQSSGIFERSGGLWILLEFVCNKYFEGQADQLKEYTIAVEAFGRPPEFDKKRDSIVRVEAHRLRKRLDQFYQVGGANRPMQIVIPPGQYAPRFVLRTEPDPVAEIAPAEAPPQERAGVRRHWTAAAILLVLGAATGLWWSARSGKQPQTVAAVTNSPRMSVAGTPSETVRIMAGSRTGSHLDSMGRAWSADQFYSGGGQSTDAFRALVRTSDPTIYRSRRSGDFRYDIPLAPGVYELRLFFVETKFGDGNLDGGGETSRLFKISANGKTLLDSFDVILDASGANTADVKVFKRISPADDGFLHLQFQSYKDRAFVNAIELVPGDGDRLRPIRFVAGATGYTDKRGQMWLPESYVSGGRLVQRQEEVSGTPDPGIHQGERYGNFSYAIPVAPGRYTVVLHFAEQWLGPHRGDGSGVGSRVFDVYCNGRALLESFDIFKEAGQSFRAVEKKFTGLRANAQGKLNLTFVTQRNYACINAIEVIDEGN
ncbi:MAG: malectin domain-containing carbohydrate-binding protein [Bryobacteraceae bacterium]